MALSEQDLDLIESYLEGGLSPEEKSLVESKMADSPEFAQEVDFQRKVLAQIQAERKSRMKAEMLTDFRQMKAVQAEEPVKRGVPWYWAAAAAIVLVGAFYFVVNNQPGPEALFDDYYQAYDGVVIARGEETALVNGINAYKNEDYEQALEVLLNVEHTDLPEGQRQLLIGNCYMNLDQPNKALASFGRIDDQVAVNILYNRDWYIALALLKSGDVANARQSLEQIATSSNIYASQAQALLEESVFR